MPTVKELKEFLDQFYKDDKPVAYAIWCDEDVKIMFARMKESEYFDQFVDVPDELSKEAIEDILNEIHSCHDSEYGITWTAIKSEIDRYISEHYKRKE